MSIGIYCIRHRESGKRYIGKSINVERRLYVHLCSANAKSKSVRQNQNPHLGNALRKYGVSAFDFLIIETFESISPQELADREVFWMDYYKTNDRNFGYNLVRDGSQSMVVHQETKDKLKVLNLGPSNPNYGNFWSESQKEAMSIYAKTRHATGVYGNEWKQKIAIASSRVWADLEKRKKMAEAVSIAKRKFKFHQCQKDGTFVKEWDSIKDIVTANPNYKWQNIYSVCNGYKKSYMGFVWKKVER